MLGTTEFNRLMKLAKKINNLTTDEERLQFCKKNSKDVKIRLDSDYSFIQFVARNTMSVEQDSLLTDILQEYGKDDFADSFGNSDGVINLFNFIGITAEGV